MLHRMVVDGIGPKVKQPNKKWDNDDWHQKPKRKGASNADNTAVPWKPRGKGGKSASSKGEAPNKHEKSKKTVNNPVTPTEEHVKSLIRYDDAKCVVPEKGKPLPFGWKLSSQVIFLTPEGKPYVEHYCHIRLGGKHPRCYLKDLWEHPSCPCGEAYPLADDFLLNHSRLTVGSKTWEQRVRAGRIINIDPGEWPKNRHQETKNKPKPEEEEEEEDKPERGEQQPAKLFGGPPEAALPDTEQSKIQPVPEYNTGMGPMLLFPPQGTSKKHYEPFKMAEYEKPKDEPPIKKGEYISVPGLMVIHTHLNPVHRPLSLEEITWIGARDSGGLTPAQYDLYQREGKIVAAFQDAAPREVVLKQMDEWRKWGENKCGGNHNPIASSMENPMNTNPKNASEANARMAQAVQDYHVIKDQIGRWDHIIDQETAKLTYSIKIREDWAAASELAMSRIRHEEKAYAAILQQEKEQHMDRLKAETDILPQEAKNVEVAMEIAEQEYQSSMQHANALNKVHKLITKRKTSHGNLHHVLTQYEHTKSDDMTDTSPQQVKEEILEEDPPSKQPRRNMQALLTAAAAPVGGTAVHLEAPPGNLA